MLKSEHISVRNEFIGSMNLLNCNLHVLAIGSVFVCVFSVKVPCLRWCFSLYLHLFPLTGLSLRGYYMTYCFPIQSSLLSPLSLATL